MNSAAVYIVAGTLIGLGIAQLSPVITAKAQPAADANFQFLTVGHGGSSGFLLNTRTGNIKYCFVAYAEPHHVECYKFADSAP